MTSRAPLLERRLFFGALLAPRVLLVKASFVAAHQLRLGLELCQLLAEGSFVRAFVVERLARRGLGLREPLRLRPRRDLELRETQQLGAARAILSEALSLGVQS